MELPDPRPPKLPARFTPLRRMTRTFVGALSVAGPLLWAAGFVIADVIVRDGQEIDDGLKILAASFAFAFLVLIPTRIHRVHEEDEAP